MNYYYSPLKHMGPLITGINSKMPLKSIELCPFTLGEYLALDVYIASITIGARDITDVTLMALLNFDGYIEGSILQFC